MNTRLTLTAAVVCPVSVDEARCPDAQVAEAEVVVDPPSSITSATASSQGQHHQEPIPTVPAHPVTSWSLPSEENNTSTNAVPWLPAAQASLISREDTVMGVPRACHVHPVQISPSRSQPPSSPLVARTVTWKIAVLLLCVTAGLIPLLVYNTYSSFESPNHANSDSTNVPTENATPTSTTTTAPTSVLP